MNKRYIDFVPSKNQSTPRKAGPAVRAAKPATVRAAKPMAVSVRAGGTRSGNASTARTVVRPAAQKTTRSTARTTVKPVMQKVVSAKRTTGEMAMKSTPVLGVVEDLNTHFVKTDVPKRPLSEKQEPSVVAAKAKNIKARGALKGAKRPAVPVKKSPAKDMKSTYTMPKSPFINQNKVVKRPLSGNIYRKEIAVAVKEEPKGPVTIIAKPEKNSHVGVIVTIILTIILGAAAGTVAFLLLPK